MADNVETLSKSSFNVCRTSCMEDSSIGVVSDALFSIGDVVVDSDVLITVPFTVDCVISKLLLSEVNVGVNEVGCDDVSFSKVVKLKSSREVGDCTGSGFMVCLSIFEELFSLFFSNSMVSRSST